MLFSALLLGLLGSLHCLAMCGPIAFLLPLDQKNPYKKMTQIFVYHIGRLLAYGIMGLLFGFLGKGLAVFGLQQKLSIIIGILLVLMAILPVAVINRVSLSPYFYSLVAKLKTALGKELQKKSTDTFLSIGFLNGFLPCGLVYMALLASIAMGNPGQGSVYMIFFGIGTVPLMTTVVFFARFLKNRRPFNLRRLVPVFVILIGLFFILRGLGLGIPYISPQLVDPQLSATLECVN